MTKTLRFLVPIALVALLTAGVVAQHGHGPTGAGHAHAMTGGLEGLHHGLMRSLHHVELSDDQRHQMQQLHQRFAPEMESLHEATRRVHQDLARAVHAESFDEGAVRQAAAAFALAQEDAYVRTAEMLFELRGILTDEQMQKVHEVHQLIDALRADPKN